MKKNLMIITPIFKPATGGASTYYNMLANALIEHSENLSRVIVMTEYFPGQKRIEKDGCLTVLRLLPFRSARKKGGYSYFLYFLQNAFYLLIPLLIYIYKANVLLAHSSFHNHPNIFHYVIRWSKFAFKKLKLVSDIRDRLLPYKRFQELNLYDAKIVCSQGVKDHCESGGLSDLLLIPVIQEKVDAQRLPKAKNIFKRFNIPFKSYFLCVGLVKPEKGVQLVLDSFLEYQKEYNEDTILIFCGIVKDVPFFKKCLGLKSVYFTGPLIRNEVLSLMNSARLCLNLSLSEGMPRASLEALALNKPVLLPKGVPEFEFYASHHVMNSNALVNQMKKAERIRCDYPIANHYIENVLPLYEKVLFNL